MASENINRFLGGDPLSVFFRLVLLSILIGVVLSAFGLDPFNIVESIFRLDPPRLGNGLRRDRLGVALFPARRRDRDPDLADRALRQRPARALSLS